MAVGLEGGAYHAEWPALHIVEDPDVIKEGIDSRISPIILGLTEGVSLGMSLDERIATILEATSDDLRFQDESTKIAGFDDLMENFLRGSLWAIGHKVLRERLTRGEDRLRKQYRQAAILGHLGLFHQFEQYRGIQNNHDNEVYVGLVHVATRAVETLSGEHLLEDLQKEEAFSLVDGVTAEWWASDILREHGLQVRHADLSEEKKGRDLLVVGKSRNASIQIKAYRSNASKIRLFKPRCDKADIGASMTFPKDPMAVRFKKSHNDTKAFVNKVKTTVGIKRKKEPYRRSQARRH